MAVGNFIGIAISGKAGAGKDTVAEALIAELRALVTVDAYCERLSRPIYEEAREVYGMVGKDRPLLQHIGDAHTQIEPSYYARLLVERVRDPRVVGHFHVPRFPIVTDLRKTIEAEYLKQCGFFLVRLEVNPGTQRERLLRLYGPGACDNLGHWTEKDLDDYARFHYTVWNEGANTVGEVAYRIIRSLRAWSK